MSTKNKPPHVVEALNQINALIEQIKIAERDGYGARKIELITKAGRIMMDGLRSEDREHYEGVVEFFDGDFLASQGITAKELIEFYAKRES
ncbi:MAG: hypothetical protein ABIR24_14350 [Verrucomicrobiota bacterium]